MHGLIVADVSEVVLRNKRPHVSGRCSLADIQMQSADIQKDLAVASQLLMCYP